MGYEEDKNNCANRSGCYEVCTGALVLNFYKSREATFLLEDQATISMILFINSASILEGSQVSRQLYMYVCMYVCMYV